MIVRRGLLWNCIALARRPLRIWLRSWVYRSLRVILISVVTGQLSRALLILLVHHHWLLLHHHWRLLHHNWLLNNCRSSFGCSDLNLLVVCFFITFGSILLLLLILPIAHAAAPTSVPASIFAKMASFCKQTKTDCQLRQVVFFSRNKY